VNFITLDNTVIDWRAVDNPEINIRNIFYTSSHEIEIIGIYEVKISESTGVDWADATRNASFPNTLYINGKFAEYLVYQMQKAHISMLDDEFEINIHQFVIPSYILHDAMDMQRFSAMANTYLNSWFAVSDFSETFPGLLDSMNSMSELVNIITYAVIAATIIIMMLFMTLFLYDRRKEIGIYLALGQSRIKIISIIIMETIFISIIALSLGIFTGRIVSENVRNEMLETHLTHATENRTITVNGWPMELPSRLFNTELSFLYPGPMSFEEMLDAFDTTLDFTTVTLFFTSGITTVIIASIMPVTYLVKLNPKKILL